MKWLKAKRNSVGLEHTTLRLWNALPTELTVSPLKELKISRKQKKEAIADLDRFVPTYFSIYFNTVYMRSPARIAINPANL